MPACPSCRQSRWMYPWALPFLHWVSSLTGRYPYECLSCGWRGWQVPHRSRPDDAATDDPHLRPAAGDMRASWPRARVLGAWVRQVAASLQLRRDRIIVPAAVGGVVLGIVLALVAIGGREESSPKVDVAAVSSAEHRTAPLAAEPEPLRPLAANSPAAPALQDAAAGAPAASPGPILGPGGRGIDKPVPTSGVKSSAAAGASRRVASPATTRPRYRGRLVIDSDPDGARVYLNGRFAGVSPIELDDLPAGSRVVRVEAEGYEPWSSAARVVANQRTRVTAVLQPSQR